MTQNNIAAFFDVDGTLVGTDIVDYLSFFVNNGSPPSSRVKRHLELGWDLARIAWLELRGERSKLNEVFYAHYGGMCVEDVKRMTSNCYREMIEPNNYPDGYNRVRYHLKQGHKVVLVTGSLDFIVEPIAKDLGVQHVISAALKERNGYFTGRLVNGAVGEKVKAERMRELAKSCDIDLGASYAYGDSRADLPMLEAVGKPAVVNPSRKLEIIALERKWAAYDWKSKKQI